jgi:transforming growth factor-beta-induced protein
MTIVQLAESVPTLSTLVDLLVNESLVDILNGTGPFTVFAPTNDAFDAAQSVISTLTQEEIKEVLLYHVVAGAGVKSGDLTQGEKFSTQFAPHNLTVQTISPTVTIHPDGTDAADATVTQPDNLATNGVVHIVDTVLVPAIAGPAPAPTPTPQPTMTIVQLAQATPTLSTLVDLLVNASLVETLNGTGPFTVFAPTNDAFDAAQSVIATLTQDQIKDVLTYHVVAANAKAADLTTGETLNSLFASHNLIVQTITPTVTIHPDGTGASDATVTLADNLATNGVVHIVDTVLVPTLSAIDLFA